MPKINIEKLLLFLTALILGCANPPRMNRVYDFSGNKLESLEICKNLLQQLEYEIDIYAPESFILTTKPTRLRRVLRKYDYIVYNRFSYYFKFYNYLFFLGGISGSFVVFFPYS